MRLPLFFLLTLALAGCTKSSGPLKLYFLGANRLTSGNRTAGPADTLATSVYLDDSLASPPGLKRLYVTVDYAPRRAPFAYPTPLSSFLIASVTPSTERLVYLDTLLPNAPKHLLYSTVFGVRTATGTERWTFEATDLAGNTAARSFVISQRRSDSTATYNSYTLKLNVPATRPVARRFLDLKSGLALPSHAVVPQPDLQRLTDAIVLPDGLRLASPDSVPRTIGFGTARWPLANRRHTLFHLTPLTPTTFAAVQDTLSIRQQYVAPVRGLLGSLVANQVYAFRTADQPAQFGLLLVKNTPTGTTPGLQLEVRIAKRPL